MRAWLSHRPSLPSSPNKARKSGEQSRQHGIDPQMGESDFVMCGMVAVLAISQTVYSCVLVRRKIEGAAGHRKKS